MSFQVKFNQASIDKVQANIKEAFQKVIRNNNMLNEVGQLVVTDVVEQTRLGKSIPLGGDLPLLRDSTIDGRIRLKKSNNTGEAFEEGLANNTFSGQLLRSIKWFIEGPGRINISPTGKREAYKNIDGSPQGTPPRNKDLGDFLADRGRSFLGVRPVIKRRINRVVKDYIKRALVVARLSKNNVDS